MDPVHARMCSAVAVEWCVCMFRCMEAGWHMFRSFLALITATPYFLLRVAGTSLKSAFSSYLSTTFTVTNFVFLAHATATAKKVRPHLGALQTCLTVCTTSAGIEHASRAPQSGGPCLVVATGNRASAHKSQRAVGWAVQRLWGLRAGTQGYVAHPDRGW